MSEELCSWCKKKLVKIPMSSGHTLPVICKECGSNVGRMNFDEIRKVFIEAARLQETPEPDSETEINYPCIVDRKKLNALMLCGDAIIRNPQPDRIELWQKIKEILVYQMIHGSSRINQGED